MPVSDPTLALLARARSAGLTPVQSSLPAFLTEGLDELDRRAAAGTVRHCRHLRREGSGLPVYLPWQPGRLRCGACAVEAQGRLSGSVEDSRCDICGVPVDTLWSSTLVARDIVVLFAACGLCRLSGQAGGPA